MDKRTQIYQTILNLLDEKSNPSKITMQDVAKLCDMGKSTMYEYFKDKDDMLFSTLVYYYNICKEELNTIDTSCYKTAFTQFVLIIIKLQAKCKILLISLIFGEANFLDPERIHVDVRSVIVRLREYFLKIAGDITEIGIKEGIIAKDTSYFDLACAQIMVIGCTFVHSIEYNISMPYDDVDLVNRLYDKYVKSING